MKGIQLLKLPSFQHGIQNSNFSGAYIFGNKKKHIYKTVMLFSRELYCIVPIIY